MEHNLRVLLVGPPGCGKTARIKSLADNSNRRLVVLRASLSERVDFGGCLVPDMRAGITRALPLELLADLKTTSEPTLLFIDDLGQAPLDVQAALMRLFDGGDLSPAVLVWAATNRPGDRAGVMGLCEPLRSRFHLAFSIPAPVPAPQANALNSMLSGAVELGTWEEEVAAWCEWQIATYPECVEIYAWHKSPQLGVAHTVGPVLYGWQANADPALRYPDFRSWESVCRLWTAGARDNESIGAAVGKGQAAAFLAFAALAQELPSPADVWQDPENAMLPSEPSARCLTAVRLGAAVTPKTAEAFVTYIDRLPAVFGALAARDAFRRLGSALASVPAWQKWFLRHQALFTA
jgi:hypothetical protein